MQQFVSKLTTRTRQEAAHSVVKKFQTFLNLEGFEGERALRYSVLALLPAWRRPLNKVRLGKRQSQPGRRPTTCGACLGGKPVSPSRLGGGVGWPSPTVVPTCELCPPSCCKASRPHSYKTLLESLLACLQCRPAPDLSTQPQPRSVQVATGTHGQQTPASQTGKHDEDTTLRALRWDPLCAHSTGNPTAPTRQVEAW